MDWEERADEHPVFHAQLKKSIKTTLPPKKEESPRSTNTSHTTAASGMVEGQALSIAQRCCNQRLQWGFLSPGVRNDLLANFHEAWAQ